LLTAAVSRYLEKYKNKFIQRSPDSSAFPVDNLLLSHNGVLVPTVTHVASRNVVIGEIFSLLLGNASIGLVALSDSFRPELSASRGQMKGLPWRVYSTGNLSLFRAVASAMGSSTDPIPSDLLQPVLLNKYSSLEIFCEDLDLQRDGCWSDEPLFHTDVGLLSLKGVFEYLENGKELEVRHLTYPDLMYGGHRAVSSVCASVLASRYLDIVIGNYDAEKWDVTYKIVGMRQGPVQDGELLFKPLTFVGYGRQDSLLRIRYWQYNREHAFAGWLIKAAPHLTRNYPGVLNLIKNKLFDSSPWNPSLEASLNAVNATLERLADLPFELRPPRSLLLKPSDFGD
jgi:hypothetical protein